MPLKTRLGLINELLGNLLDFIANIGNEIREARSVDFADALVAMLGVIPTKVPKVCPNDPWDLPF